MRLIGTLGRKCLLTFANARLFCSEGNNSFEGTSALGNLSLETILVYFSVVTVAATSVPPTLASKGNVAKNTPLMILLYCVVYTTPLFVTQINDGLLNNELLKVLTLEPAALNCFIVSPTTA